MYDVFLNPGTTLTMDNGAKVTPVATIRSEDHNTVHIIKDDYCYVLVIERNEVCRQTPYWFRNAVEVLKTLPLPS